jgi:hypothetical protein
MGSRAVKHMTEEEAVAAFSAEVSALLTRWRATISAADHWSGYPECGEDIRMTASIEVMHPDGYPRFMDIDLGRYLDGER